MLMTEPKPQVLVLARWLSYVLHPAFFLLTAIGLLSAAQSGSAATGLRDALILLLGLLPGFVYLAVQTWRGHFSHIHLINKEERRGVLLLLLAGLGATLLAYRLLDAPAAMIDGLIIGLIGGVLISLITWFWKISFHAAVAMGCAALFVPSSLGLALVFAALGLVSGIARLPLRHHTPAQVAAGWLYGALVTLALLWAWGYL